MRPIVLACLAAALLLSFPDEPRLIELEEDRITVERLDPGLPVITVFGGVDLGSLITVRADFDEEIVRSADGL
jgi:hypothetical protein